MLNTFYIESANTSRIADNLLKRQFNPPAPNQVCVSDITYIRMHEGFLYLAPVIDLFSRLIVDWSMDKNMNKQFVINALLMATYQRQPKNEVIVHSDQGSQYGSLDLLVFMKAHNLVSSMSRQGNCHDDAEADSFFATIKNVLWYERYIQHVKMRKLRYLIVYKFYTILKPSLSYRWYLTYYI